MMKILYLQCLECMSKHLIKFIYILGGIWFKYHNQTTLFHIFILKVGIKQISLFYLWCSANREKAAAMKSAQGLHVVALLGTNEDIKNTLSR